MTTQSGSKPAPPGTPRPRGGPVAFAVPGDHGMPAASEVEHMRVVLSAATRAAQDTDLHLPRSCNLRRNTAIC